MGGFLLRTGHTLMKNKQTDIVSQVVALFRQLQQERQQHQARIDKIDHALGELSGAAPVVSAKPAAQPAAAAVVTRRGRGGNAMPLRVALAQVLAHGPKTKEELMSGVRGIGYRFAGSNPMNSMQAFLYGPGKKLFKRVEGKKFVLAGGAAGSAAAVKGAAPATKAKRNISPAARKRMAEGARKRWAAQRGGVKAAAPKPAKARRALSAEARKRISDAVKAR